MNFKNFFNYFKPKKAKKTFVSGIKLQNLSHSFENHKDVLKNINFHFQKNKIIAIIGKAGSGKTVLLKHLNGLLLPTSGKVIVDHFVFSKNRQKYKNINKIRRKIGFVFQSPEQQLFEETVERDIMFGPLNFGISKAQARENMFKYLKLLKLKESYLKFSPFFLSGGQKRKVAISGILAYEPEYILFDQLASGLDIKIKSEFLNFLLTLKQKYFKTIIFTSSNMDDVLKIADQVIVLDAGEIVYQGKPQDLFFDVKLCQKLSLFLPDTLNFLQKLGIPLNSFKKFNFLLDDEKIITNVLKFFDRSSKKEITK